LASATLSRGGHPVDAATFHTTWQAAATIDETGADFRMARAMGVRSFPALLLDTGAGLVDVSPGYAHASALDAQLRTLLARFARA